MNRVIEITVLPDGQTQLETKGFPGESCREASRFLEAALGNTMSETVTSEFHEGASQSNTSIQQADTTEQH